MTPAIFTVIYKLLSEEYYDLYGAGEQRAVRRKYTSFSVWRGYRDLGL